MPHISRTSLVTKKQSKRAKAGRNSEKGKQGFRLVSGCPICLGDERIPLAVTVGPGQRTAGCKAGHRWKVV